MRKGTTAHPSCYFIDPLASSERPSGKGSMKSERTAEGQELQIMTQKTLTYFFDFFV